MTNLNTDAPLKTKSLDVINGAKRRLRGAMVVDKFQNEIWPNPPQAEADLVQKYNANTWQNTIAEHKAYFSGLCHSITVTFTDTNIFKYTEVFLLKKVSQIFNSIKKITKWILIVDLSSSGRFHLHGAMSIGNIHCITRLRKKLEEECGISMVKLIDNENKWRDYCFQQYTPEGKSGVKLPSKAFRSIRKS